jgi:hypothetical protein
LTGKARAKQRASHKPDGGLELPTMTLSIICVSIRNLLVSLKEMASDGIKRERTAIILIAFSYFIYIYRVKSTISKTTGK